MFTLPLGDRGVLANGFTYIGGRFGGDEVKKDSILVSTLTLRRFYATDLFAVADIFS